jgi:AbiEi antitoxin C-terminal domain
MRTSLGVSAAAAKLAILRLAKHGLVASPARGFYVIVPREYQRLGCLPADQFIPALMERPVLATMRASLRRSISWRGASPHHRPQQFQVMTVASRRPIECGVVRVAFVARKRLEDAAEQLLDRHISWMRRLLPSGIGFR